MSPSPFISWSLVVLSSFIKINSFLPVLFLSPKELSLVINFFFSVSLEFHVLFIELNLSK